MKVTTLLLVAAVPTATVVWSDMLDPAASPGSWVNPQHAYDYLRACEESSSSREICACTAKHILVESPTLPAVSAGPGQAPSAAYDGYRESCERWAEILGLLEHGESATVGAGG